MIEIIKELSVEVTKPNIFQALVAKQYDMNTRFLKVTLMDCGTRIDIPAIETAKVVINAERKDGQSKGFDGVINDDGTVTVPLHSWMLELDGTVICDISVIDTATDDNKKLTTTSFTLIVEKAAYGGDDITSDPQYDVLVSLLETCSEAGAVAQEALEKSNEANAKYDACVEATENANKAAADASAVRSEVEAGGFIESLKELNKGLKLSAWVGTEEEYAAIAESDRITNCLYFTDSETDYIVEQGTEDVELLSFTEENISSVIGTATWYYEKSLRGVVRLLCKGSFENLNCAYKNFEGQYLSETLQIPFPSWVINALGGAVNAVIPSHCLHPVGYLNTSMKSFNITFYSINSVETGSGYVNAEATCTWK